MAAPLPLFSGIPRANFLGSQASGTYRSRMNGGQRVYKGAAAFPLLPRARVHEASLKRYCNKCGKILRLLYCGWTCGALEGTEAYQAPRCEGRGASLCPESRFLKRPACILFRTSYSWGLGTGCSPGPYLPPADSRVVGVCPVYLRRDS